MMDGWDWVWGASMMLLVWGGLAAVLVGVPVIPGQGAKPAAAAPSTTRVSTTGTGGQANGWQPSISAADGTYVVFVSVLFSLLGGLALFALRRSRPNAERPYRVWGYPLVPAFFIAGALFMVVNTLMSRPVESLAGLVLLAIGLPVYLRGRA